MECANGGREDSFDVDFGQSFPACLASCDYFEMRLAYAMAMFNVLAPWYGWQADADGVIHLSIAEFSL